MSMNNKITIHWFYISIRHSTHSIFVFVLWRKNFYEFQSEGNIEIKCNLPRKQKKLCRTQKCQACHHRCSLIFSEVNGAIVKVIEIIDYGEI